MKDSIEAIKGHVLDHDTARVTTRIVGAVFLIGLSALACLYLFISSNIEGMYREMRQAKLEQCVKIVDRNLEQTDSQAISLCLDTNIRQIATLTYFSKGEQIKLINSALSRVNSITVTNPLIHSLYVYYPALNRVLGQGWYDASQIEDVQYVPEVSWYGSAPSFTLTRQTSANLYNAQIMTQKPADVFKLTHLLYADYAKNYVVLNIHAQQLTEFIRDSGLDAGEAVNVYDAQGELIISTAAEAQGLHAVAATISAFTNWRYELVDVTPPALLAGWRERAMAVAVTFLLVAGCIGGALVAFSILKPVNALYLSVAKRRGDEAARDKLGYVQHAWAHLVNENRAMSREALLRALLTDSVGRGEALLASLRESECAFDEPDNLVVLAEIEPGAAATAIEQLEECLRRAYAGERLHAQTVRLEPRRTAALVNFDASRLSEGALLRRADAVIAELGEQGQASVAIGVSRTVCDPNEMSVAWAQARRALDSQLILGRGNAIHYDVLSSEARHAVTYPFDIENELLICLPLGRRPAVEQAMTKFQEFIVQIPSEQLGVARGICDFMRTRIRQLASELPPCADMRWPETREALALHECVQKVRGDLNAILDRIEEYQQNQRSRMAGEIIGYIDEHYAESLTVESIADALHISSSHCHRLLREERSMTPMNYLADVRMKNAARLLEEGETAVKDIAAACGYDSLQTFYRQFNRQMNMTPTDYRALRRIRVGNPPDAPREAENETPNRI